MENAQELVDQNLIPVAAQRMWTSTLTLQDREFCFILNWAVREDVEELADSVAMLTRAISELCVTGGLTDHAAVHPESNICYRGGGFDDDFRSFFVERRKFRIPNYLATSFSESVTKTFLRRVAADTPKVLWLIHIDPDEKCHHVNLVKKTNVEGEQEYLFAPYSAFTVKSVKWCKGTVDDPHRIELTAAVDNLDEPEGLAPWS